MKRKVRPSPKGRTLDPQALEDVRGLLGDAPRRRDLLIEHLHRINDRYGYLSAAHLAALAEEMRLALTEVYEVATFYHHFEVVKEGEAPPPALTVRVGALARRSPRSWRTPVCAAWAAPAFRRGASGASSPRSPSRVSWR